MERQQKRQVSEQESREVAEASRQQDWSQPSFLREMFLGHFRFDLIAPYPVEHERRPEFAEFYERFELFLLSEVDPIEIDTSGEYPQRVLEGLRRLGAFGMKISKQYGGLGLTNWEYQQVMKLLGSYEGNLSALLSAHQSIGVPQPLKLFGSETLKGKYLPRCARGEISAFALTEPDVGSDPARMSTTATLSEDGSEYRLNGTKLWCTNGTLADLLVVMATDPETSKISAFVVETAWDGVVVEGRCHFMGLRALANAVISFRDVRVPAENLIGEAGRGLKIALTTLNDGRLMIPNASVGVAKSASEVCRTWASERVQWGRPVGKHEAISHKLADIATFEFAMESIADLVSDMADRGDYDIRLEAAAAKEWNSFWTWQIVDETMQIRGGRGYETESSLRSRGEAPIGVERMMRDFRINRIFEGSSEIMHLFMAREAVDKHLQVAGDLIAPNVSSGRRLRALVRSVAFYALWYPSCWIGWSLWPRFASAGKLGRYLRFVDSRSRKLARQVFHGMMIHRARLQNKQAFLFRLVDIANELFAMSASISRASTMKKLGLPHAAKAERLTLAFCRGSKRRIDRLFRELWDNDDAIRYRLGVDMLEGEYDWLESGALGLDAVNGSRRGRDHLSPVADPPHRQTAAIR